MSKRKRDGDRERERDGHGESDRFFRRMTCHVQVVEPDREPELEKRLSAVEEGVRILLADKAETDGKLDAILSALDNFSEGWPGAKARENENGEPLVQRSRSYPLPAKVGQRIFICSFLQSTQYIAVKRAAALFVSIISTIDPLTGVRSLHRVLGTCLS